MIAGQRKHEWQWTAVERKATNLDQRLKSLIMSVLPDDQMNYVINYLIAKSTWDDLILYHEGSSDVKESRVMDQKLCYNTFKFKEGETLTQTFTRYKSLMNELVNDDIKLSKLEINTGFVNGLPKKWLSFCQSLKNTNHVKDSELASLFDSLDDEEDTRSSHEFLNDLEEEYKARALLAKSKRLFKKGTQRFSSAKATDQTECHNCGKKGYFARDCWSKTSVSSYQSPFRPRTLSPSLHKPELRHTKDFEAKYNKVKAKLVLLSSSSSASKASMVKNKGLNAEAYEWDKEKVSSDDNEMVKVKVPMALAEENDVVSKEGAINDEWVKISMRKKRTLEVDQLTKDPSNSGLKELVFVKSSADDTKVTIPDVERPLLFEAEGFILLNCDNGRILPYESQRNTTDSSVAVNDSLAIDYNSADEFLVCIIPLPPLKKLDGVEPIFGPKTLKSILRSKSTFKAEAFKDVTINEISSALARGNKSSLASKVHSDPAERKINPRNPQHAFKKCKACGSLNHTTTDHYDIEWFKRSKALQAKKAKALKSTRSESSNANRSKTPTKRISQNFSSLYTPKQNGVAERKNTLIEGARTMLSGSVFSKQYWIEAVATAYYTKNRSTIMKRHLKTPYEIFRAGMLIKAMAKELNAALAHECLFVDFLFEEEPKKVFMNKRDETAIVIKHKARLVAQGYNQQEGINYDKTFAPVVRVEVIKIFLAFSTYINFIVYQMDVKSALLNGKLKEEVYVKQLLGFESMKTPMVLLNNLRPDLNGKAINKTQHRGMIRSLMYLTTSRPEIQFSTCLCARYQANPKESYLTAVKRIFRKSTSGACQLLGGKLVCWSAKKQQSVAMSSAEAEYVAAARCCANILWMKSQLTDYGIMYEKTMVCNDRVQWGDRAKETLKKSCLPPRWRLLMGQINQCVGGKTYGLDQISNKDATILYCLANGVHVDYAKIIWEDLIHKLNKKTKEKFVPYPSVHNWILKPNQPEEPPFTDHMKAICNLDIPMKSKDPKYSSPTKEVPQGKNTRARSGLRRKQSSKHIYESTTKASKSQSGHLKKETKSSSAIDTSPSHPSPPIPMDMMLQQILQLKLILEYLLLRIPYLNNMESEVDDISRKVKLEDLTDILKDTRSAFFTLDSPTDEPIIVLDESEEEENAENAKDTKDNLPQKKELEQTKVIAEVKEALMKAKSSYPDINHLTELLVKLKTLDSLLGLLKTVTNTLNKFVTLVENASGANTTGVPSTDKATASPAEGEKDADTNMKNELVDLLGIDIITQYYNKKLLYGRYCEKMKKRRQSSKIINCEVLTKKAPISLKVYREDAIAEVIEKFKASNLQLAEWGEVVQACPDRKENGWKSIYELIKTRIEYFEQTKKELHIDFNKYLQEQDPLDELNVAVRISRLRFFIVDHEVRIIVIVVYSL
uniref:CCHC-type domain-containing protein n=1 Tax=Tanacetum cinerariifolium TaxID=118510 RepID=A0A699GUG0_TANCI|nr:hypothetical protein [Tanacetum cinerariifolium]